MDPRSPEVIGRHGLLAALDEKYDEATRLLTQALERKGVVLGRFISNRYLEEIRFRGGGGNPSPFW